MSIPYTSGDFTTPAPVSAPVFSAPIEGVNVNYLLTQDYVVNIADYSPLALGTAHPDYADFVLCSESSPADLGGLKIRWTRTYAKLPAQHTDIGLLSYTFIGYHGYFQYFVNGSLGQEDLNIVSVLARDRFTKTVPVKMVSDYFLCVAGQTYVTPDAIPISQATKYTAADAQGHVVDTDLIADAIVGYTRPATVPSRTTYEGWITADAVPVTGSWSIRAKDDELIRWNGPIWRRVSSYIKAQ